MQAKGERIVEGKTRGTRGKKMVENKMKRGARCNEVAAVFAG